MQTTTSYPTTTRHPTTTSHHYFPLPAPTTALDHYFRPLLPTTTSHHDFRSQYYFPFHPYFQSHHFPSHHYFKSQHYFPSLLPTTTSHHYFPIHSSADCYTIAASAQWVPVCVCAFSDSSDDDGGMADPKTAPIASAKPMRRSRSSSEEWASLKMRLKKVDLLFCHLSPLVRCYTQLPFMQPAPMCWPDGVVGVPTSSTGCAQQPLDGS